jgi:type VI secretion system protein ImpI
MELTLDVIHPPRREDEPARCRTFRAAGGIIGRASHCDWVLDDPSRILSGQHAEIRFDQQRYQLVDLSSNGITRKHDSQKLPHGTPVDIEHGHIYRMGELEVRARLQAVPVAPQGLIPDDAFLELGGSDADCHTDDLLDALLPANEPKSSIVAPAPLATEDDHHRIESEHVRLPRRAILSDYRPPEDDPLAEQICQRLGLDLNNRDNLAEQALQAASLLRVLLGELQLSLRAAQQLDETLGLRDHPHPGLQHDTPQALLEHLLQHEPDATGLLRSGCHRLRAQILAMQQANRQCTERLTQLLAPHHLVGSMGPLRSDSARWRALCEVYARRPEQLQQLFSDAFNRTYQDQARLLGAFHQHLG